MKRRNLQELMDACRGRHDLVDEAFGPLADALREDESLGEVFARSQGLDERLREAVQDVVVPPSLEARLLAAVSAGADRPEMASGKEAREPAGVGNGLEVEPAPAGGSVLRDSVAGGAASGANGSSRSRPRTIGRRLAWGVAAAAMAVAASLLGVWLASRPAATLTDEGLIAHVQAWTRETLDSPDAWQRLDQVPPPEDHPPGPAIRIRPRGWKRLRAMDDSQAVAYELAAARMPPAVLYVVRTRIRCGLSPAPYRIVRAEGLTSGWTIAAWQTEDFLYVLVVPGEGRSLDGYVRAISTV